MDTTLRRRWSMLGLLGGLLLAATIGLILAAALSAATVLPAWYDTVTHALGWFAVALLVAVALDARGITRTRLHALGFVAVVTFVTLGLGVVCDLGIWAISDGARLEGLLAGAQGGIGELLVDGSAALFGATVAALVLVPGERSLARRPHHEEFA